MKQKTIGSILRDFGKDDSLVQTAGRLVRLRRMGKVVFGDLYAADGKIQIISQQLKHDAAWNTLRKLRVGDYARVIGKTILSDTGTPSILAEKVEVVSRAVSAIPDKFHGVRDKNTLRRQRYLDIIGNPNAASIIYIRSQIIDAVRNFLKNNGYLEVDTPILSTEECASDARQFSCKCNASGEDVFLRVSAELELKQMVIAGFEHIFEFCRNFRNEGVDHLHRQEFLNLELFSSYESMEDMRRLVGNILRTSFEVCEQNTDFTDKNYSGIFEDLSCIPVYHVTELIWSNFAINLKESMTLDKLIAETEIAINLQKGELCGASRQICLNRLIRHIIKDKGFYYLTGYPAELYPLYAVDETDPKLAQMNYLMYGGMDIAQICCEETNLLREKEALQAQVKSSKKDVEPSKRFLTALGYGMPPTVGIGISMERLFMLVMGFDSMYDSNFFNL